MWFINKHTFFCFGIASCEGKKNKKQKNAKLVTTVQGMVLWLQRFSFKAVVCVYLLNRHTHYAVCVKLWLPRCFLVCHSVDSVSSVPLP